MMKIRSDVQLHTPASQLIAEKYWLTYLGATLYNTGHLSTELNRRIGTAWGDFCKYERAWKHTTIKKSRIFESFQALVTSKLMYSLNAAWLNKAERRRLDGFHARRLRKMLHIPPAFLTHISNKEVFQHAGQQPYTVQL